MAHFVGAKLIRRFSSGHPIVRVRFAPSPTGYLHIGSLRTALFNYLFAKKHPNGKLVLRIEDTDQTRIVPDSIDVMKEDLSWFGIKADEGPNIPGYYGPYIQSERLNLYKKYAYQLLENGFAYRCFCSAARLELMRREARKRGEQPKYDNRCRQLTEQNIRDNLAAKAPFVIRYKLKPGFFNFKDAIAGDCAVNLQALEGSDPVIYKSDGFPTYHLANVVDDHHMEITHVYRGIEWLNSTPKHLMLFDSLGWNAPVYGHLPLITSTDGTKLSKRHGDFSVKALRELGYEAETLITYLAVLSGGIKDVCIDTIRRVYSLEELVDLFDINAITTSANRLDQNKMLAVNKISLTVNTERHLNKLRHLISTQLSPDAVLEDEKLLRIFKYSLERISTLPQLVSSYSYFFKPPEYTFSVSKFTKSLGTDLVTLTERIIQLVEEDKFSLNSVKEVAGEAKYSKTMQLVRCCLCDTTSGPPVMEVMDILGKEVTLGRLRRSLVYIKKSVE